MEALTLHLVAIAPGSFERLIGARTVALTHRVAFDLERAGLDVTRHTAYRVPRTWDEVHRELEPRVAGLGVFDNFVASEIAHAHFLRRVTDAIVAAEAPARCVLWSAPSEVEARLHELGIACERA